MRVLQQTDERYGLTDELTDQFGRQGRGWQNKIKGCCRKGPLSIFELNLSSQST